jgi:RHS repeat-associated protein
MAPNQPIGLAYDKGTVTATIANASGYTPFSYVASANWSQNDTAATLAAKLASAINSTAGSVVTATPNTGSINLYSNSTGAAADFNISVSVTDSMGLLYPYFLTNTSFSLDTYSMTGGAAADTSYGTIYSYQIPSGGYAPNGNILSHSDSVMGTWNYTYDNLNRLVTSQNTATTSTSIQYANDFDCFGYDPYGNRTVNSLQASPCTVQSGSTWVYGANNQLTGVIPPGGVQPSPSTLTYDLSGNVVADSSTGNQYLYDGEGRICAVASTPITGMTIMTGYLYDANGTRVAKGAISAWSCDPAVNGFQTTNDYILGPSGEQMTEMGMGSAASSNSTDGVTTSGLAWQHTNVYAAGSLIATYDNDGLHFYFNDPLGTRRAQTDYAGVLEQTCQSLPFGDGLSCSGGNLQAPTEHHFTAKERDTESGNDYFEARYYSSAMGRFMSPDNPKYAEKTNPQSWNLYAYVDNYPLTRTDPTGTNWFNVNGNWQWHDGNTWNGQESDYTMLLRIQKTGQYKNGAEIENLTLLGHGEDDVLASGTGYTGSSVFHLMTTPNGDYEMNLNKRGGPSSEWAYWSAKDLGWELGAFSGLQKMGDFTSKVDANGATAPFNFKDEWGDYRANLNDLNGNATHYYLHGKDLYYTTGRTYTHGCTTEPDQRVLKTIFSLNPAGVGEGAKNGRLLVSVSGK